MNVILTIGLNTYKEIIRDRVLYGLIVFALLLIGVSLALGQLTFKEQARISANFGLTGIHLSSIALAIFVGSTLVTKEIDKKTVLTLLARPISRVQFVLGKALGLMMIIASIIFLLSLVMMGVFFALGISIDHRFVLSLYGIFLESLVLLSFSLVFSSFTRPILVVSYAVGLFLVGHWMDSLIFFAEKSEQKIFVFLAETVNNVLPNLELFNWRSLPIYNENVLGSEVFYASLYSLSWFCILVTVTTLILRKKDFG